jgi:hypothetical protein
MLFLTNILLIRESGFFSSFLATARGCSSQCGLLSERSRYLTVRRYGQELLELSSLNVHFVLDSLLLVRLQQETNLNKLILFVCLKYSDDLEFRRTSSDTKFLADFV